MSIPRTLLQPAALAFVALAGCHSLARGPVAEPEGLLAQAPGPITAGTVIDLELRRGESWRGAVSVADESYLELVVEQRSLDVILRVTNDDNEVLASADGAGGIGVDERLSTRLGAGHYVVVLSPRPDGSAAGHVRLRVESLRPFSSPEDNERLRLTALDQNATHLDGSNSELDWQRSYELSVEALAGWRELDDTPGVIRTLDRMTSLEREFGRSSESIEHGREAVRLSVASGLDLAEAESRYWLAQSLNRAGRTMEADTEFALGLEAAERAGSLELQGRILNWQGLMSYRRNEPRKARPLFERALDLRRRAHDTRGIPSITNNLGLIALQLGELSSAVELFEKAIVVSHQLGNPGAELLARSNLAGLLVSRGQWQEALESLSAGLEVALATADRRNESILGGQLARLLLRLGEPEPARALLRRALELDTARGDGFSQAWDLLALAQAEQALGNLEESEDRLRQARELSAQEDLRAAGNLAVRRSAALRLRQGRPQQALELLAPTLRDPGLDSQPLRHALVLKTVGEAHLELGAADEALRYLEQALEALGRLAVPEIRFDIAYLVARVRHAQGDVPAALREAEAALQLIESLRLSVDDPDLRATFLSRTRETYDFAVACLLEMHRTHPDQGFDRQAFATFERARARSLVEMLSRARSGAEQALDSQLLENARAALADVAQARRRLGQAVAEGRDADLVRLQSELESARGQLSEAEDALRRAEPRYASLRYADDYSLEDLQRVLQPGVTLVEFNLQSQQSTAFVVSRNHFEVVELAPEEAIRSQAESFHSMLATPSRRAYEALLKRARSLGDLVMEPLVRAIGSNRHVIVVPDGALAYVPFEALRLADGASAEDLFVIERWVISYVPSAGVLRTLLNERPLDSRGRGLVAFADPLPPKQPATLLTGRTADPAPTWKRLPGARAEVSAIAATLGAQRALAWVDREADEGSLKSSPTVHRARWIHLASHAQIDERTPANSAIILAPSPGEDGYLRVREVFGLELTAELVVLSGCETALGRQIRGEGLIGLTRAFLYAGARGLQVSLWKVDDNTTPELMSNFYGNLARDLPPAEALREAKLASLADPHRSHPFHWAPFVLIGG